MNGTDLSPEAKALHFLKQAGHFKLGHLPTESRHPRTTKLSQLSQNDLPSAIALLKDVELEAMKSLTTRESEINAMSDEINETLRDGGRIFFCGCGATGRLSLSLETLWREECERVDRIKLAEQVISFIAGGDYALVRSIENFEDHPEYGARQLHDLGFGANDLLIGTSEGGETPFVIGAVEEAARVSKRKPFFVFCNPVELLSKTVERSRRVIENPNVRAFDLLTGPMALAGSTRLQATTALMLAAGAALFPYLDRLQRPRAFVAEFMTALRSTDFSSLAPLIEKEAEVYRAKEYCVHRTSRHGITVVTDTTERSPTFSLLPFESALDPTAPLSWTYLCHAEARDSAHAWELTLGRKPRALSWEGFKDRFGEASLSAFDFSPQTLARRQERVNNHIHIYDIHAGARDFELRFDGEIARFQRPASLLCDHLLLKCALNISSTLVMGRLGRFSGNLMLYVRAANNKLVDRAIRYVQILLEDEKISFFTYEEICAALFVTSAKLAADEPAVWRTFEHLKAASGLSRLATGK